MKFNNKLSLSKELLSFFLLSVVPSTLRHTYLAKFFYWQDTNVVQINCIHVSGPFMISSKHWQDPVRAIYDFPFFSLARYKCGSDKLHTRVWVIYDIGIDPVKTIRNNTAS